MLTNLVKRRGQNPKPIVGRAEKQPSFFLQRIPKGSGIHDDAGINGTGFENEARNIDVDQNCV